MIEAYRFGVITVDGTTYQADLIIYPDRVNPSWWRREGHNLSPQDLDEVFQYRPDCLIIGQGRPGLMEVPPATRKNIQDRGIELVVCPTEEAVKRYNALPPGKRVVAALHLTC